MYSQNQCLAYLGSRFRSALYGVPGDLSDIEVGQYFINRHICVHVDSN